MSLMRYFTVFQKVNECVAVYRKSRALFTVLPLFLLYSLFPLKGYGQVLSLEQALQLAIQHDPQLKGNAYREQGFNAQSDAAAYWENPQISASVQNIPTDGFAVDQEPMTQFKVGLKQQLPRGDENVYTQQKYKVMGKSVSIENQARKAWLKKEVTLTWLNWFYASRRITLLDKEKALLTQLLDFANSSYSQGVSSTVQQDILKVRLALLSLDDKYVQAYQQQSEAKAALSKWYGAPLEESLSVPSTIDLSAILQNHKGNLSTFLNFIDSAEPFTILQHHPEAMLLQFQTQIEAQNVNIAREQTKSRWAFEASYGYRQDDENGVSRADFVSLGVQVDLPFFNQSRQDASISAAASKMSASETDFRLKVNELASKADVLKTRLSGLSERKTLYESALIGETEQLSEAELTAYTSDTADITDVVNANLMLVKVQDDLLNIDVERAKTFAELAYLYLPSHINLSSKE